MKLVKTIHKSLIVIAFASLVFNFIQPVLAEVIYNENGVKIIQSQDNVENQIKDRGERIERIKTFLLESTITVVVIVIFAIFFGVSLYLALGVILLAFFGGIGGQ